MTNIPDTTTPAPISRIRLIFSLSRKQPNISMHIISTDESMDAFTAEVFWSPVNQSSGANAEFKSPMITHMRIDFQSSARKAFISVTIPKVKITNNPVSASLSTKSDIGERKGVSPLASELYVPVTSSVPKAKARPRRY